MKSADGMSAVLNCDTNGRAAAESLRGADGTAGAAPPVGAEVVVAVEEVVEGVGVIVLEEAVD